jgi:hypothetical protein
MASPLTCNINGIPPQERERYGQVVETLLHAIQKRQELPDGFAFEMDTKHIGTADLTEWIALERRCCPFSEFEVVRTRQDETLWLH